MARKLYADRSLSNATVTETKLAANVASRLNPTINIVTDTSVTAIVANHYVLTNTAQTNVTLPASPTSGDIVWVTVENGLSNNTILRNGNKIKSASDNLVLDIANVGVQFRYVDANVGWTLT